MSVGEWQEKEDNGMMRCNKKKAKHNSSEENKKRYKSMKNTPKTATTKAI